MNKTVKMKKSIRKLYELLKRSMLMKYVKRVFLTFCVKKVTSQLNRIVVLSIFKKKWKEWKEREN